MTYKWFLCFVAGWLIVQPLQADKKAKPVDLKELWETNAKYVKRLNATSNPIKQEELKKEWQEATRKFSNREVVLTGGIHALSLVSKPKGKGKYRIALHAKQGSRTPGSRDYSCYTDDRSWFAELENGQMISIIGTVVFDRDPDEFHLMNCKPK